LKEGSANNTDLFRLKAERADRISKLIITLGGYGIILCIILILVFLIYQSLPLSFSAKVEEIFSVPLSAQRGETKLAGIDSYKEVIYFLSDDGVISFYNINEQQYLNRDTLIIGDDEKILAVSGSNTKNDLFAIGTDKGQIITIEIEMKPVYADEGRIISSSARILQSWTAPVINDSIPNHIEKIAFSQTDDGARVWSWVDHRGHLLVRIYDTGYDDTYFYDLTDKMRGSEITDLAISNHAENLVVAAANNNVFWFDLSDFEDIKLKDRWNAGTRVSAITYLMGDQAVGIGGSDGSVSVWLPVRTPSNLFKFEKLKDFKAHDAAVNQIYPSPRNRNFLTIDIKGSAKLHYSTSGITQVEFEAAEYPVFSAGFSPKSDALFVVSAQKKYSLFNLDNPHPETTAKTLFGKVWYEGYPEAELVWQSTGGSDEFESKLSLMPLIFGTFKGTLFAMIFSVPLALLAAIYVSQFSPVSLSRKIKPTIEIMAALPSVVVGFLAGLYFSPFFEKYLMAIMLTLILMPLLFLVLIVLWNRFGEKIIPKIPPGFEIIFSIPVILLTIFIALNTDAFFERLFFNGNFQQWLYSVFEVTYETRNSIVVGFALGFAVIPIIFTVSEDAITNVPQSLTSASLALGASPWQTVQRIVLPAASGGIFAAIMLGLGRAVGETMIVLMATGNTPIIDLNPFNGFRAMSACIAVEMPEAPVDGTLYRVLFLTGLLLFAFTFILNTASSLVGDRLRKKYARF
jgi:phosphate transport system permease protein